MVFERTRSQEETYLAFQAGEVGYVLPLSDVGQIVAEIPEDIPQVQITSSANTRECAVIVQDNQGLVALAVEKVTGLVQIPPNCQYELPVQARSMKNRWITGVAYLEGNERLCYLLDCRQLRGRFLQESL
jgi:chemotaxis signal transduction protein